MESGRSKVSIIIPHYNQKECLERLLPTIANQTYDDYEVIIIDDCTPDRSVVGYIKGFIKDYDNMRLVENAQNLLFIKTVNKGIVLANGEYICLLNADTKVTSNFVQRNVEIMDADRSVGALSCIIVDQHGNNWFSGGSFRGGFPVNLKDDFQGIRTADFAAGTASFYRREVFERIGLFDESLGMYHEDVEFGLRIRAQTNYKACMFSDKLVVHNKAPSIPHTAIYYYGYRNHILILRKYCPRYLPKVLLSHLRDIADLLATPISKPRPKSFLFWHGIALSVTRGVLAGLVKRQSK